MIDVSYTVYQSLLDSGYLSVGRAAVVRATFFALQKHKRLVTAAEIAELMPETHGRGGRGNVHARLIELERQGAVKRCGRVRPTEATGHLGEVWELTGEIRPMPPVARRPTLTVADRERVAHLGWMVATEKDVLDKMLAIIDWRTRAAH